MPCGYCWTFLASFSFSHLFHLLVLFQSRNHLLPVSVHVYYVYQSQWTHFHNWIQLTRKLSGLHFFRSVRMVYSKGTITSRLRPSQIGHKIWSLKSAAQILLPPANVVWREVMFYRCLSVNIPSPSPSHNTSTDPMSFLEGIPNLHPIILPLVPCLSCGYPPPPPGLVILGQVMPRAVRLLRFPAGGLPCICLPREWPLAVPVTFLAASRQRVHVTVLQRYEAFCRSCRFTYVCIHIKSSIKSNILV